MVSCFDLRFHDDADLIEHAKRVVTVAAGHQPQLQSRADLLLYGHRRLTEALRRDSLPQPSIGEWAVAAVSQLLRQSAARFSGYFPASSKLC